MGLLDIKNLASIQEQLEMSPGTSNLKLYKLFLSEIINDLWSDTSQLESLRMMAAYDDLLSQKEVHS